MKTIQQIQSRITHLENRNRELKNLDGTIQVLKEAIETIEEDSGDPGAALDFKYYISSWIMVGEYGKIRTLLWVLE